ncbi:cyanophycinase [Marinihelvus fidelis]|uniref:Cyanophycinase n=1 Tax=Marinihelvus fidelis TaxID=2613842 RepID=A0A5N0TA66_9GAMM|nr:cyanophycinase [Marinihelvus fidelis]KAA9131578.1 cyanophycinase [Marinihelvus fidelis]
MPSVPQESGQRGWLIPIGGAEGKRKDSVILKRFVALCGGEAAKILVIPTASQLDETGPAYVELFEEMDARALCMPVETREQCFEEQIVAKLDVATGIFMTGGNQLRLSTILGGTPVARAIRRRHAEGVPVAGTSAGAAIMSEHMIAGGRSGPSPRESGVELAPGLGLTNRAIVDQHFSQRGRMGRLLSALSFNPFICGLGIDENTAAFINADGVFEVVGRGTVTVIDPSGLRHSSMSRVRKAQAVTLTDLRLHVLAEGARYDLEKREALVTGDG